MDHDSFGARDSVEFFERFHDLGLVLEVAEEFIRDQSIYAIVGNALDAFDIRTYETDPFFVPLETKLRRENFE